MQNKKPMATINALVKNATTITIAQKINIIIEGNIHHIILFDFWAGVLSGIKETAMINNIVINTNNNVNISPGTRSGVMAALIGTRSSVLIPSNPKRIVN